VPVAVVFNEPVLPPFDITCVIAPELGTVFHAIVGFDSAPNPFPHSTTFGCLAGDNIKTLSRVDNEEEIDTQIPAPPLNTSRIAHIQQKAACHYSTLAGTASVDPQRHRSAMVRGPCGAKPATHAIFVRMPRLEVGLYLLIRIGWQITSGQIY
jgi:hypothetical protein